LTCVARRRPLADDGFSPVAEAVCWIASTLVAGHGSGAGTCVAGRPRHGQLDVLSAALDDRSDRAAAARVAGAGRAAAHAGAAGLAELGDGQALTVAVGVLCLPRHRRARRDRPSTR
jgi:hypothetical protein